MKIQTLCVVLVFMFTFEVRWSVGQEDCLECHGDVELTTENDSGDEISLYVDAEKFTNSIHGEFDCTDCHADVGEIPHEEKLTKVDCSVCHEDVVRDYQESIHAKAHQEGAVEAASCVDCHGKHAIRPSSDLESNSNPLKIAYMCATCHADPKIVKKYHIPIADPLAAYKNSVHGIAVLSEKNFDAATCVSCHGSHNIRSLDDTQSPIHWSHVPETCGQCHSEIHKQYSKSIHWTMAKKGVRNSPVCIDCHGEHVVKAHDDPASPVHPLRVSAETCERCHASELLTQRYGLPEARAATYEDSYHGLAVKGGSLSAANCASCHGIHKILPSSNPASLIHPANLAKTCGSCHLDATENFAKGSVHLTTSTTPGRVVLYVKNIYILLIVVIIGGMIIHNGADFIKRSKQKLKQREQA
ncbi:MAG: cytochrome c3 family protein [bacterium]